MKNLEIEAIKLFRKVVDDNGHGYGSTMNGQKGRSEAAQMVSTVILEGGSTMAEQEGDLEGSKEGDDHKGRNKLGSE